MSFVDTKREDTPICGIFGFIGKSKNQPVSWNLANALMIKTEPRGEHATGFWSAERGDGAIWFDKEAIKPTEYAKRSIWKDEYSKADVDLLIAHCRQCSQGVGTQATNRNNHPHVTSDFRAALVHNGRVPEHTQLKAKFELHSDCDSEVLLALFETGYHYEGKDDFLKEKVPNLPPDLAFRAIGMMEIFKHINYGWMAIAVGERVDDGSRLLWLHRDDQRPIHIVDLRESLGQIFFFSTPEIWRAALTLCPPEVRNAIPAHQEVGIFPAEELWLIQYTPDTTDPKPEDQKPIEWGIHKWKINRTKFTDYDDDEEDGKVVKQKRLPRRNPAIRLISRLNEKEDVIAPILISDATASPVQTEKTYHSSVPSVDSDPGDEDGKKKGNVHPTRGAMKSHSEMAETPEINKFMELVETTRAIMDDFLMTVEAKAKEESYSQRVLQMLSEHVKHIVAEVKGTTLIIQ